MHNYYIIQVNAVGDVSSSLPNFSQEIENVKEISLGFIGLLIIAAIIRRTALNQ